MTVTKRMSLRTGRGDRRRLSVARYDAAGNRTALIEGNGTSRVTWSYDDQNQLLKEHRTGTNAYRQTYTYDATGNRTLKNVGGTRTTYGYDAAGNQQVERTPSSGRTTVSWNYENQRVLYQFPSASRATYAYNADNRRVEEDA